MKLIYFPGCCKFGTGNVYEESILPVVDALGIEFVELADWNCCGATAYMSVDEPKAFALSARNLALAEDQFPDMEKIPIVAPCSACYLGLLKAKHMVEENEEIRRKVINALRAADLDYKGRVEVRNPLDIFANDYGIDNLKKNVKRPLKGLKVACYYGCQIVRPYSEFENHGNPETMDRIMAALGAEPIDWPHKTRCCGGAQTWSSENCLKLNHIILKDAMANGADVVATACPLCQFNLECFQSQIRAKFQPDIKLPVTYFTQLMGVALGIDENKLGMDRIFLRPSFV